MYKCPWCQGSGNANGYLATTSLFSVYIHEKKLILENGTLFGEMEGQSNLREERDIEYCPKCGRKL